MGRAVLKGGLGLVGRAGEKGKGQAGLEWVRVRVGCFVFFQFFSLISFQTFTQNLFKILNQLLNHTINQKPMHST
jgi:hypothetical protein